MTDFSPGGEVLGFVCASAYAEQLVVGVDQIVAKPPAMPWEEAGAAYRRTGVIQCRMRH